MAKAKLAILYGEGDEDVVAELATALQKGGHTVQQAIGRGFREGDDAQGAEPAEVDKAEGILSCRRRTFISSSPPTG